VDDETARELAVETADRLIYERGIRSVGVDDIRDAAGVSLKRLYRLFPAKEQLAEAALRHRDAAFTAALAARVESVTDPRERLLAVFDHLRAWFDEPDFRGCPFINAWGEAGAAGACVADAVADQKRALRAYLERLVAAVDGLAPAVAGQLFILANGAMVAAATLHWPEAAGEARTAAAILLEAQLGGGDASVRAA
jgi:AcrR family transcriptional regulator